jgi:Predicted xylanase/chitin deacetylase
MFSKQHRIIFILLLSAVFISLPVYAYFLKGHSQVNAYNNESENIKANVVEKEETTPSPKPEKQNKDNQRAEEHTNNDNANIQTANTQSTNNNVGTEETIATFVKNKTVVYSGSTEKMQIALTFDDGPDNKYTPKILDILSQNNIKATFFVVGKNVKLYPNNLKRISSEGHAIGSHTYSHSDLNKLTTDQVRAEMTENENAIDSVLGYHLNIMRPPYGLNSVPTIKTIADMGYKVIDWSVDTVDWNGTTPAKIMEYITKQTKPGGIILHHCAPGKLGLDNTISVLPTEIATLKAKGYQFVTVPELLNNNN